MPRRKAAATPRVKPSPEVCPNHMEGPALSIKVTPQKEKDLPPEVRAQEEQPDRGSFCDTRVIVDPQGEPAEESLGDQRTVIDEPSPLLEFLDGSNIQEWVEKSKSIQIGRW